MRIRGSSGGYLSFLIALVIAISPSFNALAQAPAKGPAKKVPFQPPPKAAPTTTKGPAAPPQKGGNTKLPAPEDVSLETKDGMTLKATFYPGSEKEKKNKETVPIIMVHGLEGQRGDYHSLATKMQEYGYASLVPDLRGHGQSKTQKRHDGSTVTLEAEKMNRVGLEDMFYDVLACKKFLMERNNAGELNIEQLCIVGAEFGSILAVRFAAYDWSLPDLPAYKQGKDVKALVLLSPHRASTTRTTAAEEYVVCSPPGKCFSSGRTMPVQ